MSLETTAKLMTAEEFGDWIHQPENTNKWWELVRGEVIELPPPTKPHGVLTANTTRMLGNYTFQRRKGYITSNDTGVILEREPDTGARPGRGLLRRCENLPRSASQVRGSVAAARGGDLVAERPSEPGGAKSPITCGLEYRSFGSSIQRRKR